MQCNVEKALLGFWKPCGIATVAVHCTKYNYSERTNKTLYIATLRLNDALRGAEGAAAPGPEFLGRAIGGSEKVLTVQTESHYGLD